MAGSVHFSLACSISQFGLPWGIVENNTKLICIQMPPQSFYFPFCSAGHNRALTSFWMPFSQFMGTVCLMGSNRMPEKCSVKVAYIKPLSPIEYRGRHWEGQPEVCLQVAALSNVHWSRLDTYMMMILIFFLFLRVSSIYMYTICLSCFLIIGL